MRAGAILTIDLEAIVSNWRLLSKLAKPAECAAVVKVDAYPAAEKWSGSTAARDGLLTCASDRHVSLAVAGMHPEVVRIAAPTAARGATSQTVGIHLCVPVI